MSDPYCQFKPTPNIVWPSKQNMMSISIKTKKNAMLKKKVVLAFNFDNHNFDPKILNLT